MLPRTDGFVECQWHAQASNGIHIRIKFKQGLVGKAAASGGNPPPLYLYLSTSRPHPAVIEGSHLLMAMAKDASTLH